MGNWKIRKEDPKEVPAICKDVEVRSVIVSITEQIFNKNQLDIWCYMEMWEHKEKCDAISLVIIWLLLS